MQTYVISRETVREAVNDAMNVALQKNPLFRQLYGNALMDVVARNNHFAVGLDEVAGVLCPAAAVSREPWPGSCEFAHAFDTRIARRYLPFDANLAEGVVLVVRD